MEYEAGDIVQINFAGEWAWGTLLKVVKNPTSDDPNRIDVLIATYHSHAWTTRESEIVEVLKQFEIKEDRFLYMTTDHIMAVKEDLLVKKIITELRNEL